MSFQVEGGNSRWPGQVGADGFPLRDSDHRFEWDRQQFRDWCTQMAGVYGYFVTFHQIGHAVQVREGRVQEAPGCNVFFQPAM